MLKSRTKKSQLILFAFAVVLVLSLVSGGVIWKGKMGGLKTKAASTEKLVYLTYPGSVNTVNIVDADGTNYKQLTNPATDGNCSFTINENGKLFLYCGFVYVGPGYNWNSAKPYSYDIPTGVRTPIASAIQGFTSTGISYSGLYSVVQDNGDLYVGDIDTGFSQKVFTLPSGFVSNTVRGIISTDQTKIIISVSIKAAGLNIWMPKIYLVNSNGSSYQDITNSFNGLGGFTKTYETPTGPPYPPSIYLDLIQPFQSIVRNNKAYFSYMRISSFSPYKVDYALGVFDFNNPSTPLLLYSKQNSTYVISFTGSGAMVSVSADGTKASFITENRAGSFPFPTYANIISTSNGSLINSPDISSEGTVSSINFNYTGDRVYIGKNISTNVTSILLNGSSKSVISNSAGLYHLPLTPTPDLSGVINSPPVASFIATPVSGAAPLAVNFTDTSTDPDGDAITGWAWNFGDSTSSTAKNPSHTYSSADTYIVSLIVQDSNGAFSVSAATKTITVTPQIYNLAVNAGTGGTAAGTTTGIAGSAATITATSNYGYHFVSWALSGAGSLSSTTANPTTFTFGAGNATVIATFTLNTYPLTINKLGTGNGGVYVNGQTDADNTSNYPVIRNFPYGGWIYIIPLWPSPGSAFEKWSVGGCDEIVTLWGNPALVNTCLVNMTSDRTVTVYYKLLPGTINVNSNLDNTIVTVGSYSGTVVAANTAVNATTTAPAGSYTATCPAKTALGYNVIQPIAQILPAGGTITFICTYTLIPTASGLRFTPSVMRSMNGIFTTISGPDYPIRVFPNPITNLTTNSFDICTVKYDSNNPNLLKTCSNPVRIEDKIDITAFLLRSDDGSIFSGGVYTPTCDLVDPNNTDIVMGSCNSQIDTTVPNKFKLNLVQSGAIRIKIKGDDSRGNFFTKTVIIRVPSIGTLE